MPDSKEITLTSANCGSNRLIEVDGPDVSLTSGDTLVVYNDLTPKEDAKLYVYAALDKSNGTPISGFCDGAGEFLEIEKATGSTPGEGVCEITADEGTFQYKITADMHHDYDPIIIVEPKDITDGPGFWFLPLPLSAAGIVTTVIVAGAFFAVAGYFVGSRAERRRSAP